MPREPQNPREWQDAVDAAKAMLCLDSARHYGLVMIPGLSVDVKRCMDLVYRGSLIGIVPSIDAVERFVTGWIEASAE